jgi:arsenate reductase-like glutaredoxin family protein
MRLVLSEILLVHHANREDFLLLMLAADAILIKRPLIVKDGTAILVGFRVKENDLAKCFCLEP